MNKKKLLKHLVFLMFFIFIADLLAKYFHWYFSIQYFDMIMHFLGGLWAGLFFLWFFGVSGNLNLPLGFKIIIFVFLVGLGWEFFEFFTNNYMGGEPFNIIDSLSDILLDLMGGIVAVFYFFKRIMTKSANNI